MLLTHNIVKCLKQLSSLHVVLDNQVILIYFFNKGLLNIYHGPAIMF